MREMWAFRAHSEHEAAARFLRLADRLAGVGAPPAVVELAVTAVEDERRHRAECAAMAERHGHDALVFAEETAPEVAPPALAPAERVLYESVAFCCITESINAALLAHTLSAVTDAETRRVVRDILADEVSHSRIGWGHLASRTDLSPFLAPWLPVMLEATVPEALFGGSDDGAGEGLVAYGVLSRATLQQIFLETMSEVVLPGLRRFGVATDPAEAFVRRLR